MEFPSSEQMALFSYEEQKNVMYSNTESLRKHTEQGQQLEWGKNRASQQRARLCAKPGSSQPWGLCRGVEVGGA